MTVDVCPEDLVHFRMQEFPVSANKMSPLGAVTTAWGLLSKDVLPGPLANPAALLVLPARTVTVATVPVKAGKVGKNRKIKYCLGMLKQCTCRMEETGVLEA